MSQVSTRTLQIVSDERGAYGLRYNDHARYRKHCANKVHRLRRSLKMTHGKGREFKKLPVVPPENLKDGHFQLYLFESERAYSFAQELYEQFTKSDDAKTRNIAMGRFRRAVKWSGQLVSEAQTLHDIQPPRISSTGLAEAVVYHLAIRGRLLRLQDEFQPGLEALVAARAVLDALSKAASSSRDHAIYVQFSDEIAPEIRHCAHELGLARAYDIDGIVSTLGSKVASALTKDYEKLLQGIKSEGAEKQGGDKAKQLQEIIWEGQPVPVRSPELVDVLLRVQQASEGLPTTGQAIKPTQTRGLITKFDGVLLALSEAEDVAKKLADVQKTTSSPPSGPGARDAHFISSFITYQLLSRRTQRDLLLTEALLTTPTPGKQGEASQAVDHRVALAVVKLLDTILQSLNQMRSLSVVDESADLTMAIEGRLSYTKAKRAFFLSKTYEPHNKYSEAVALTQRANLHLREAHTNFADTAESTPETAFYPLTLDSVKTLEQEVQNTETDLKKHWFAHNGGKTVGNQHQKPKFFDIALNYIELPMEKLQEKAGIAPDVHTTKTSPAVEKRVLTERKAEPEPEEPAPAASQQSQGMLGSLLGGWWGRK
ncbi:signal recognition particle subunit SRP68, putative [Rhizoctonia solani AG-3 Rhs1AP]|uniref:Signal recognition particle subunit SRP68 n=1 Tax=Rhizoctonia solani AG-3 Rhs1AP TaxID=1086054 RepID=X8JNY4_9AGAM|nr:signal recognition particle subunit SRP68, putative [Rhizoctonia solani AG-3 Rhs1AP]